MRFLFPLVVAIPISSPPPQKSHSLNTLLCQQNRTRMLSNPWHDYSDLELNYCLVRADKEKNGLNRVKMEMLVERHQENVIA